MIRVFSFVLLGISVFTFVGCGDSGGTKVIEGAPEMTQEEMDAYNKQAFGASEADN